MFTSSSSRLIGHVASLLVFAAFAVTARAQAPTTVGGDFGNPITVAAPENPSAIAFSDFNGDGSLDMVEANPNNGTVGIYLGNGDGTFQAPVFYTVGNFPFALAVGDLNGDGKDDIVVANFNKANLPAGDTVSVLLSNGNGTFRPPVSYRVGHHPTSVVIADLNGDGKLDLATADNSDNTVSILHGDGHGAFASRAAFFGGADPATSLGPRSLVVADFDHDGFPDIAATNCPYVEGGSPWDCDWIDGVTVIGRPIGFFFGSADGSFTTPAFPVPLSCGDCPNSFLVVYGDPYAIALVNPLGGDNPHLAYSTHFSPGVAPGLGNPPSPLDGGSTAQIFPSSTRNFGSSATLNKPTTGFGRVVLAGDFNNDGNTNLLGISDGSSFTELVDDGTGSFLLPVNYGFFHGSVAMAAGDLNGDFRRDVAVGSDDGTIRVFLNVANTPRADSNIVLTTSANPAAYGGDAVYTATVTSSPAPTGVVTFVDDSGIILLDRSASDPASGRWVSVSAPHRSNVVVHAIYSGDTDTLPATASLTQTISGFPTSVTLTSSMSDPAFLQPVKLLAFITSPAFFSDGRLLMTGNVTYFDGDTAIGSAPVVHSIVFVGNLEFGFFPEDQFLATLTVSNLSPGTHSITAQYSGDANYVASPSDLLPFTVGNDLFLANARPARGSRFSPLPPVQASPPNAAAASQSTANISSSVTPAIIAAAQPADPPTPSTAPKTGKTLRSRRLKSAKINSSSVPSRLPASQPRQ